MTDKLKDKVAIVTGASKGIGKCIALNLAQQGVKVVLSARSEDLLLEVAEEIKANGGECIVQTCDLKNENEIVKLISKTIEHYQRLDILICNAGIGHFGPLEKTKSADFDEIMAINAKAPFILFRESIPHLKQQSISYMIAIGSVVSVKGYPNQSAYTASKHALMGMVKSVAKEVNDDGIRTHIICPGGVNTELVTRARPDIKTDELMQPEEISNAVMFLLNQNGNAVIDELHLHRQSNSPFS
jgi:3-oxoacyl-[acyl-carrier protein] reductase